MRMSCNGCRALRQGCSHDCIIKPCLQWIQSSQSQANATHFLSKFYGRAGLLNLITSGPAHLHPEIFKSLLYEACGRIINPIHGSVGLLRSSDWRRCEAAVEAVLEGTPLVKEIADGGGDSVPVAADQVCDIRHVSNASLRRVRTRPGFKRSALRANKKQQQLMTNSPASVLMIEAESVKFTITGWDGSGGAVEHDSFLAETTELGPLVNSCGGPGGAVQLGPCPSTEIGLDLTLGMKSQL